MELHNKLLFKVKHLPFVDLDVNQLFTFHKLYTDLIIKDILKEDTTESSKAFNSFLNNLQVLSNDFCIVTYNSACYLVPTFLISYVPRKVIKIEPLISTDFQILNMFPDMLQYFCNAIRYVYSLQFIKDLLESFINDSFDILHTTIFNTIDSMKVDYTFSDSHIRIENSDSKNYITLDDVQITDKFFDIYPKDTFFYIKQLPLPIATYPIVFLYKAFKTYNLQFPVSTIVKKYTLSNLDELLTHAFIAVQHLSELAFTCKRLANKSKDYKLFSDIYNLIVKDMLEITYVYQTTDNCNS